MYLSLNIITQNQQINSPINYVGAYTLNGEEKVFSYFKIPNDIPKLKKFISNRLEHNDKFVFYNGKYDTSRLLYSYGIDIPIHQDIIYLGYLSSTVKELKDQPYEKWLSLEAMASRMLDEYNLDIDSSRKATMSEKDILAHLRDTCECIYNLFMKFKKKFYKKYLATYKLILKLANSYKYVEVNGVPIDKDMLLEVTTSYNKYKDEVNDNLVKILKEKSLEMINFNSPKQLQKLLYEDLKLPIIAYTQTGQPSTGVEVLKELQDMHPIINMLLESRKVEKALAFLNDWDAKALLHNDGIYYIHPTFNLHTTVTGRTSSSNPNFQQIPRNKTLKAIFNYTKDDWKFVCADYSQNELRFAALIADVKEMKRAYNNGEDLHTNIAAMVNGIDKSEVTKKQRTAAKAINFGFLYGMSAESFVSYAKMSYDVSITLDEAIKFRDNFFKLYPELLDYYADVDYELYTYGQLTSAMQRNYIIDVAEYYDKYKRETIRRAAINFPVQSSASDYVLCALYDVMNNAQIKDKVKVCGTVHDSIIMLVKNDDTIIETLNTIKQTMEHPPLSKDYLSLNIDIPIAVDIEIGPFGKGVELNEFKESLS